MLSIKSITADPYAPTIENFLSQCFPNSINSNDALIDALTSAFITTNQNRYGPIPRVETIVAIRDVLRYWTAREEPIAVLSPWGSRKAGDGIIDVAEIMALRQLEALNNRVKRFYSPGILVNLGIEDLGGYYMWCNEMGWQVSAAQYLRDIVNIIDVLDMRNFLDPVRESELIADQTFFAAADEFFCPLWEFLNGSDIALGQLQRLGWVGDLPREMIDWYLGQYLTNYPESSSDEKLTMLARYLAQSAARYKVEAKLRRNWWGKNFIQINFPQPVPGVSESLGSRRLFYRTLPMRMARTHMPPWRAKGFLCVRGDQTLVKLATIREQREYNRLTLDFRNGERCVQVDADYILG